MKNILYEYPINKLSKEQEIAIDSFRKELANSNYVLENINCLICSQSDSKLLYINDRYDIPVKTVLCRKCGFIYTNPRMNEESTKKFYESDIYRSIYGGIEKETRDRYQHRFQYNSGKKFNVDAYSTNESFFLFLKELDINYETVCEIGAGGGWNLVPFVNAGKIAIGYEPSQFLVNVGKENGINLHRGFIEAVRGEYDLVILRHVLEHFIDPLPALEQIRKHTRSFLAIEVPGIVGYIPSIQNAHAMYFSLQTLPKLLSMAEFELCNIVYFKSKNCILALFKRSNQYNEYSYDLKKELFLINKLYYRERAVYITLKIMKTVGLYNPYKKLKSYIRNT